VKISDLPAGTALPREAFRGYVEKITPGRWHELDWLLLYFQ